MNKIAKFSLASVAALSFVACDNYEEPNPQPQTNPQESILKTDDVTVADSLAGIAFDLTQLNTEGKNICLGSIQTAELPAAYEFVADVEISGSGFSRVGKVPSTVKETSEGVYSVYVNPDDLNGAYVQAVSKGPKPKEIEVRYRVETKVANQLAFVGGPANYYGPYKMTVTPFPSDFVIEENYYILGSINGWSVANAVKFNHSEENQYDDPVFTLKVDITPDQAAAGWWWKIVPESTYATGDWQNVNGGQLGVETNGDEAMSGSLVSMKADEAGSVTFEPGAGCIKESGQWLITINLEEGTYAFSSAVDYLYTPGASNAWSPTASQLLSTTDYANYAGYAVLDPAGFKFTNAPDWDHINYGAGSAEGLLSTDGGAGNVTVPAAGLYYCKVNTASLTYTTTLVETIGLIGDATPAGWDSSTPLASDDNLVWTATMHLKGGKYKFRANNSWDINLGGSLENLTQDGSDIVFSGEEGDYEVRLDLSMLPYSATLTKK